MKQAIQDNLFFYLGAFSCWLICGAFVYQVYQLNWLGIALVILLTLAAIGLWRKFFFSPSFNWRDLLSDKKQLWFLLLALVPLLATLVLAYQARTDNPIISPWQVLPMNKFFLVYLLAAAGLLVLALKKNRLFFIAAGLFYWLTFSLNAIIYKIGYGFDPFIHQAALRVIGEQGFINPKTPYYAGQYALEIVLHKLTWLPLEFLDKFLIMGVAAIVLPAVLWRFLREKFGDNVASRLTLLLALVLSFSPFIMTTPQSLAYVLVIAVVLIGQVITSKKDLWLLYLLSAATLSLQPIAGLPALLLTMAIHLQKSAIKKKEIFYAAILVANIFLLPGLFYVLHNPANAVAGAAWQWPLINFSAWALSWPNQGSVFLNFAYFYGHNLDWFLAALIGGGMLIVWRAKKNLPLSAIYLGQSATLLLAYFLTKLLPFNFLIDYEKNNYANRLLYLALIIALPFMLTALHGLIKKISEARMIVKIAFFAVGLALLGAAVYISYPRFDRYYNSHGYATSAADVAAVEWINADSPQIDYVVLANQQVGAAALRLNSFAQYFHQNIFYYSIPTGGPLYQKYLSLTKLPVREPIVEAMDVAGVDKVYVVINKYWWESKNIIAGLQPLADSFQPINNGEVYVFKFSRESLEK